MKFQFLDLDHATRILMLDELRRDRASGTVFGSRRLTDPGRRVFDDLLAAAFARGDVGQLEAQLRRPGRLHHTEIRRTRGCDREVRVPHTAARTLAEGAFNHYYIRAVARRAIHRGDARVEVFRAKAVRQPRQRSQERVGMLVDPAMLLDDLRSERRMGIPAGHNSGLSIRLIRRIPMFGPLTLPIPAFLRRLRLGPM